MDHLQNLFSQATEITLDETHEELVRDGHLLVFQGSKEVVYFLFGQKCSEHGMHFVYMVVDLELVGEMLLWTHDTWQEFRNAHPVLLHDFRKVDMKEVRESAGRAFRMDTTMMNAFLDMLHQMSQPLRRNRRPR